MTTERTRMRLKLERKQIIAIAAGVSVVAALAVGAVLLTGDNEPTEPDLVPIIEPPAIAEAGVLRAGLDTSYPPFAGEDKGEIVGIDVDVAAAVAEALGLRLEIVDVGPDGFAEALNAGDVDIALGAIAITEAVLADVSFAGSYVTDVPAYFSATEESDTITALAGKSIGAQEGSQAYWTLQMLYGDDVAVGYPTLREAFQAAADGELDIVAGDAIVGAYIGRDFPSVRFVGQVENAVPLGIAVAKDSDELEEAVRAALDRLATDGVLDAIRTKWVGVLPGLEDGSGETTGAGR